MQRHTPQNLEARLCGLWCEGFAPETAKYQGEMPPYMPLHHLIGSDGAFDVQATHALMLPTTIIHAYLRRRDSRPRILVSVEVVQRHTPQNLEARLCGLWCEGFAPEIAKYQGEMPPYVPLHHLIKCCVELKAPLSEMVHFQKRKRFLSQKIIFLGY